MDTILALLRLAHTGERLSAHEANDLYSRLVLAMLAVLGLMALNLICLFSGLESVAMSLSLFLALVTVVFWLKPTQLVLVAVIGATAGGLESADAVGTRKGAVRFVKGYVALLGKILLWGTLILWLLFLMAKGGLLIPPAWFAEAPSFHALGIWAWHRWLVLLMFSGALIFTIGIIWGKATGKASRPIVLGILALFLIVPFIMNAPIVRLVGNKVLGTPLYESVTTMEARLPLATGPTDKWAKVMMQPDRRSIRFPTSPLSQVRFSGTGFEVLCFYQNDGRSRVSPYPDRCPDDPNVYEAQLQDTSGKQNVFGYGYLVKSS